MPDDFRIIDATFRVYSRSPLRGVALLDLREDLSIRYVGLASATLANRVGAAGRLEMVQIETLRNALNDGTYVFTRHDPDDPFFREADEVPLENILRWVGEYLVYR